MVVLGGTLSVLLIAYTWGKIVRTIRLLRRAFGSREDIDWAIHKIIDLARLAPAFGLAGTFVQLMRVLGNSTNSLDLLGRSPLLS